MIYTVRTEAQSRAVGLLFVSKKNNTAYKRLCGLTTKGILFFVERMLFWLPIPCPLLWHLPFHDSFPTPTIFCCVVVVSIQCHRIITIDTHTVWCKRGRRRRRHGENGWWYHPNIIMFVLMTSVSYSSTNLIYVSIIVWRHFVIILILSSSSL